MAMIWLYTLKSGIKTIVWSDLLQTGLMIAAALGDYQFGYKILLVNGALMFLGLLILSHLQQQPR